MTYRITVMVIALLFAGCSTTHDPLPNKSTNWLRECTSDRMCSDGLSCLCGVCTKTCGRVDDCATDPATTRCSAVSRAALSDQCTSAAAGDAVAICVAACAEDNDCKSSSGDFECRDQLCVVRTGAGAMRDDAGSDASTSLSDAGHDGGLPVICSADSGCEAPCTVECKSGQMCLGNACADVLASGQAMPSSLALDSSHLYWTTNGTRDDLGNYRKDGAIQAVSLQSGEVTALASNRVNPAGIAINATHAYWLEGPSHDAFNGGNTVNDNEVWRVPLAGGDPERLVNAVLTTGGLAVDERYVYLLVEEPVVSDGGALSGPGAVYRMPNDGSAQLKRLFGVDNSYASSLFVDDAGLCWVGSYPLSAATQVGTASKDGADPHVLSTIDSPWVLVAVDASTIYWTGQDTRTIASVPRAGGDVRTLTRQSTWERAPEAIAVDRDYVYSVRLEPKYSITSVERTDKLLGASQVFLRSSELWGAKLAADDDAIYIVTSGYSSEGLVLRVAKQ